MGEISKHDGAAAVPEAFYGRVSSILSTARTKAYAAVSYAMVEAYWEIERSIVEEQGGEERAKYGDALIEGLAVKLTKDFGKGFDIRNLRFMRQFYLTFPIRNALRSELSWTHYRRLMRVSDADARMWYMNECADSHWSTRQLMNEGDNPPIGIVLCADKNDSIVEYTLPEDNDQVFAAKYLPYLPSKEELARELSAEYRAIDEASEEEQR